MNRILLTLAAISTLSTLNLSARELLCEQCVEEPECCEPQLFVERSQIFINTSFLYWTTESGVLDYAIKGVGPSVSENTFAIGDYKTIHYNWDPGFRLALTYYKCHRYWEVTGEYTWFYDKGSNETFAPVNPTRLTEAIGPFSRAQSTIDLHYHVADIYAARVFDPNPHLRMRVLGGLTMGILEQNWHNTYSNFIDEAEKVQEKWRFFGGGIRFGTTVDWFWGYQFYLTAKFSLAGLIGTYKNEMNQTTQSGVAIGDAKLDDHRFAMHTQLMLGPSWQIPCQCWSFELFAGYEMNLWFNLQERIGTAFSPPEAGKATFYSDSMLGLGGLTLRLTVGF